MLYSEDFQQCNSFSEQAKSLRVAVRAAILAYEKSGRMLDPALVYAAHGFPVFPLTIDKTPVPKRDVDANGKPIPGTGSFKKATCDPLVIRKWWTNHEYLIGLPMGKTSGIWCLDVDSPEDHADGVANWNAVAAQHEPIVTREHRSATGGPHLIFNWHEAQPIYCGLGSLPKKGISVKGEGSYIVVPPSRRKGRSYTIFSDIDPIDTPSWLSEQILQGRSRFDQVYTGPGTADLDKLAEALAFIPNDDLEWDDWTAMALRIYAATAGEGFELFDEWSFKSIKYDAEKTLERWEGIQSSPPSRTGAEKIFKMAREYGWVDKTTPTYSADALSSADAVRDEMRQQVREFLSCVGVPENLRNVWIDFYFSNRPEIARAMLVPTGVGKTRITVEELAEWVRAMGAVDMLIYMVPTHRLGEEIVALFAKHGLSAKVYRGRNAINPETLDPALNPKDPQQKRMCLNLEQVEMAYEAGLDVATSCCLRKAKKGRPGRRCKFYDVCSFQQQLRGDPPDVWITAHEMLFHAQKALGEDIAAVIIDEGFWQDGMRIATNGVPLSEMESAFSERKDGCAELELLRGVLVKALRRQPNLGGVERRYLMSNDHLANVTAEDCTRAISLEYQLVERVEMQPGMSAQDLKRLARKVPALRRARQMAAIWGAARSLLNRPDVEVSGHLVLHEDGERIALYRGVAPVCKQWQAPTLLLDATLPGNAILQAFYPQVERIADLKVEMPHVYIRQVLHAPVSAKRLIKTDRDVNREAIRRYILRRWIETGRQKTLVVCQQKYEEWLLKAGYPLPGNIAVEHFNNIEGLDQYKDVRLLILIGRTIAKPETVETYAGALTGAQAIKVNNKAMNWYQRVERGILLTDGSGVAVDCDQHPDPTAEAARWQICEGQLVQAIGRGRGVNRTPETPLDVDIVADVVLPLAVNEFAYWQPPSEAIEMLVEGIGLTSPVDMVAAWPKVWPNEKAADRTLKLLYKTLSPCSVATAGTEGQSPIGFYIRLCPSVRSLTYQPNGSKLKRRTAVFDPAVLLDPRAWLESRLGLLAFFEIEEK